MTTAATRIELTVPDTAAGVRLDRFLTAHAPPDLHLSRVRLQALIDAGEVVRTSTGKPETSARALVRAGETYAVTVPAPRKAEPEAEYIDLDVVYEDRDIIVIDKPAGLVVHPAAGHETGTLVNALVAHCGDTLSGIGGVRRPGIVHRLDKDTSGLLVVAKTDQAHKSLSGQFESHGADGRLVRRYTAFAWGGPERPVGFIDAALARSTHNRTKMAVVRTETGRHAVTHYEITARYLLDKIGVPLVTEWVLNLQTGRTHQIRVHLAHIGHPILGDGIYGAGHQTRVAKLPPPARDCLMTLGRQALHAATLGFEHPRTGKILLFHSPLPEDLAALQAALRGDAEPAAASKPAKRRRPAPTMNTGGDDA